MTRKRVPVQVQDAWLVLADAEAALIAGDYEEAQAALDLLGNAPPVVVQWATLRQADLHIARREFPQGPRGAAEAHAGLPSPLRWPCSPSPRGAGLKRLLGEDACPGLLVDQVLHNEGIPQDGQDRDDVPPSPACCSWKDVSARPSKPSASCDASTRPIRALDALRPAMQTARASGPS